MKQNTRRQFLRDSALLGTSLLISNKFLPTAAFAAAAGGTTSVSSGAAPAPAPALRAFIVSATHFGWDDPKHPAPEKQKQAIAAIRRRFPDLDVMFDTGDPHHNGPNHERDGARGDWSDIIMYQDDPIPFHYIPGNHDIAHASDCDVEFRCAALGSHEARPYYSLDIKGIHFISVPELNHTVYVTRELLEWLRLDLELNKNKTTLLLGHNSLIGYSKTYEEGYRGLINTKEILDLMNAYPNCVAWMYGHNHNYEVVKKNNKLYISNGRIGGFDPSKGKHGLGGMHIEITPGKIDIRAYSAEFGKFVEELDTSEPFRGTLQLRTSLDPAAPPAYSAGAGMTCDGAKSPVHHHFTPAPETPAELYLAGVAGATLNEDPGFSLYMVRKSSNDRQLMACSIRGDKNSYDWKNPGVLMRPLDKRRVMTLPRANSNQYTYYRVAAGRDYEITLDLQGMDGGGQPILVRAKLYDRDGAQVMAAPLGQYTLAGERQQIVMPVKFPASKITKSIYTDENSDNVFNFSVEIEFAGLKKPVMLHRVAIGFAGATAQTRRPSLTLAGEKHTADATLAPGEYRGFAMAKPRAGRRSVAAMEAAGNGMATWLYRIPNLQWQVLGAPVEDRPASLLVGPMRNLFSRRKQVAITPCSDYRAKTFVSRLRNIDSAEIFPLEKNNDRITVKIHKLLATLPLPARPEIEIHSPRADLKITGAAAEPARQPALNGHKYIIPVAEGATVTIA